MLDLFFKEFNLTDLVIEGIDESKNEFTIKYYSKQTGFSETEYIIEEMELL